MTVPNINALQIHLKEIVEKHTKNKEVIDANYSSSNTGDVYTAGLMDGEAFLAQQLLKDFFDV